MIVYEGPGDILASPRQTLVCTTNVVGAMGKGVALAFARQYPDVLAFYQERFPKITARYPDPQCGRRLFLCPLDAGRQCLLLPTKLHWRDPSPVDLIYDNLARVARHYQAVGITSLALPPPGCGNGGLDYESVIRPMLYGLFGPLPLEVDVLFG